MKGLGAAGVSYAAANMVYGGSQYADIGLTLIPASVMQNILPLLVGVIFPFLSRFWPNLGTFLQSDEVTKTLGLINQLELEAAKIGCKTSLEACQKLRTQTLTRVEVKK